MPFAAYHRVFQCLVREIVMNEILERVKQL